MKQSRTESEIMARWKGATSCPLISFCCVTYNHESYIIDALEGFLIQKTNFPFEILIHDDASTDNTANIIRNYKIKYPNIIKAIFQTENQWAKKNNLFSEFILPNTNGKYIALCEGDDYWTNPYKIQKQIQLLENNKNISFCFHNALIDDIIRKETHTFNKYTNHKIFTINDITKENFIHTGSVVTRKENFDLLPEVNYRVIDWLIHIFSAKNSNFYYFPDVMSVYRIHQGGYWSGQSTNERVLNAINYSFKMNDLTHRAYEKNFFLNILKLLINFKISLDDAKQHKHLFTKGHYAMLLYFYQMITNTEQ